MDNNMNQDQQQQQKVSEYVFVPNTDDCRALFEYTALTPQDVSKMGQRQKAELFHALKAELSLWTNSRWAISIEPSAENIVLNCSLVSRVVISRPTLTEAIKEFEKRLNQYIHNINLSINILKDYLLETRFGIKPDLFKPFEQYTVKELHTGLKSMFLSKPLILDLSIGKQTIAFYTTKEDC